MSSVSLSLTGTKQGLQIIHMAPEPETSPWKSDAMALMPTRETGGWRMGDMHCVVSRIETNSGMCSAQSRDVFRDYFVMICPLKSSPIFLTILPNSFKIGGKAYLLKI